MIENNIPGSTLRKSHSQNYIHRNIQSITSREYYSENNIQGITFRE